MVKRSKVVEVNDQVEEIVKEELTKAAVEKKPENAAINTSGTASKGPAPKLATSGNNV